MPSTRPVLIECLRRRSGSALAPDSIISMLTQPNDIALGMGKALGALAAVQLALTGTRDPPSPYPLDSRYPLENIVPPARRRACQLVSSASSTAACVLPGPAMADLADLLPKTATSESAREELNAKTSNLPSLKQTAENAGEALSGDVDLQANVDKVRSTRLLCMDMPSRHGYIQFPVLAALLTSWTRPLVSAVDRCLHGSSSLRVSVNIHAAMCLQAGQNLKEATGTDVGSQAKSGVRLWPFPCLP